MMVIVPIVVAKHSTIIRSTNSRIDVSQNVLHDLAVIGLPNFFLQYCALSFPFQPVRRINSLGDFQLLGFFPTTQLYTDGYSESTPGSQIITASLARTNGRIQVPTGCEAPSRRRTSVGLAAPDQFDSMGNHSAK